VLGFVFEFLSEKGLGLLPWGEVNDEGVRGRVVGLRGVFGDHVGEDLGELVGEVVSCSCRGEGDVHEGRATLLDKEDGWIFGRSEHGGGLGYLAS
jgi:hypothetical protein